jgi:hypothetical protein
MVGDEPEGLHVEGEVFGRALSTRLMGVRVWERSHACGKTIVEKLVF